MSRLLNLLRDLLPTSRAIHSEFYLTADALIEALIQGQYKIATSCIPEFETEDWDDDELEEIIFLNTKIFIKDLFSFIPLHAQDLACLILAAKQRT